MITHVPRYGHYLLVCDHCKHYDGVTAAGKTEQQVKEVATRWGWVFDTALGDLCRRCAELLDQATGGRLTGRAMEPMMTIERIAHYLQLPAYTVRRLARQGAIPAFKVKRQWRVKRELLDKWLDEQCMQNLDAVVRGLLEAD